MTTRTFKPALFLIAALFFFIGACASDQPKTTNADCSQTDIAASCILEIAENQLLLMENNFDWASSAIEIARAKDAWGEHDAAWRLVDEALSKAKAIENAKERATAFSDIALALAKVQRDARGLRVVEEIDALLGGVDNDAKRADIAGKLLTARSIHGDSAAAMAGAQQLAKTSAAEDAYKGRTLREIAVNLAQAGDIDGAVSALAAFDTAFTYYSAVARTEIAAFAHKAGRKEIIDSLLDEAETIGRAQSNGYFSAAVLREIAFDEFTMGRRERAMTFLADARNASRSAPSAQERSRSMSRIATRLGDRGEYALATDIVAEAVAILREEENDAMRHYSLYEAAGAAAFIGDFDVARSLIDELPSTPFGSARSLKSAGLRDLAWGMTRHGDTRGAMDVAKSIESLREKTHALSRIALLLKKPDMKAPPRYL